jgi:tetratricopeptide (TPR) repeat protein
MSQFEVLKQLVHESMGESPKDIEKTTAALGKTFKKIRDKEREVVDSELLPKEKAEKLKALKEIVEGKLMNVLKGLKGDDVKKNNEIDKAMSVAKEGVRQLNELIVHYEEIALSGEMGEELSSDPERESVLDSITITLNPDQKRNAQIIEREFREHNLPDNLIAAAIVNAIAESSLDANASPRGEDSVGLFQLNIEGAGHGMSVEDRKDPVINTRTILEREILTPRGARLRQAAADGASIVKLAAIFSKDIERPVEVLENMRNRMVMAVSYFKEEGENKQKIKEYLDEILKEDEKTMESIGHFKKGNEFASQGKTVEAETHYRLAIKDDRENAEYRLRLANTLVVVQGQKEAAVEQYWKAIELGTKGGSGQPNPIVAEAYLRLGNIKDGQGKKREAFKLYVAVLSYAKEGDPIYEEAASNQMTLGADFENWEGQRKAAKESQRFFKLPKFN